MKNGQAFGHIINGLQDAGQQFVKINSAIIIGDGRFTQYSGNTNLLFCSTDNGLFVKAGKVSIYDGTISSAILTNTSYYQKSGSISSLILDKTNANIDGGEITNLFISGKVGCTNGQQINIDSDKNNKTKIDHIVISGDCQLTTKNLTCKNLIYNLISGGCNDFEFVDTNISSLLFLNIDNLSSFAVKHFDFDNTFFDDIYGRGLVRTNIDTLYTVSEAYNTTKFNLKRIQNSTINNIFGTFKLELDNTNILSTAVILTGDINVKNNSKVYGFSLYDGCITIDDTSTLNYVFPTIDTLTTQLNSLNKNIVNNLQGIKNIDNDSISNNLNTNLQLLAETINNKHYVLFKNNGKLDLTSIDQPPTNINMFILNDNLVSTGYDITHSPSGIFYIINKLDSKLEINDNFQSCKGVFNAGTITVNSSETDADAPVAGRLLYNTHNGMVSGLSISNSNIILERRLNGQLFKTLLESIIETVDSNLDMSIPIIDLWFKTDGPKTFLYKVKEAIKTTDKKNLLQVIFPFLNNNQNNSNQNNNVQTTFIKTSNNEIDEIEEYAITELIYQKLCEINADSDSSNDNPENKINVDAPALKLAANLAVAAAQIATLGSPLTMTPEKLKKQLKFAGFFQTMGQSIKNFFTSLFNSKQVFPKIIDSKLQYSNIISINGCIQDSTLIDCQSIITIGDSENFVGELPKFSKIINTKISYNEDNLTNTVYAFQSMISGTNLGKEACEIMNPYIVTTFNTYIENTKINNTNVLHMTGDNTDLGISTSKAVLRNTQISINNTKNNTYKYTPIDGGDTDKYIKLNNQITGMISKFDSGIKFTYDNTGSEYMLESNIGVFINDVQLDTIDFKTVTDENKTNNIFISKPAFIISGESSTNNISGFNTALLTEMYYTNNKKRMDLNISSNKNIYLTKNTMSMRSDAHISLSNNENVYIMSPNQIVNITFDKNINVKISGNIQNNIDTQCNSFGTLLLSGDTTTFDICTNVKCSNLILASIDPTKFKLHKLYVPYLEQDEKYEQKICITNTFVQQNTISITSGYSDFLPKRALIFKNINENNKNVIIDNCFGLEEQIVVDDTNCCATPAILFEDIKLNEITIKGIVEETFSNCSDIMLISSMLTNLNFNNFYMNGKLLLVNSTITNEANIYTLAGKKLDSDYLDYNILDKTNFQIANDTSAIELHDSTIKTLKINRI